MKATAPSGDSRDVAPVTLGELLYAKASAARVPEAEWVLLVQSIGAADQSALRDLYARAHRMVFTLTLRIVHDRETAAELTVDVFHEVWRRASGYDPANGTVVGWIMNLARSRAIDRVRFEQRRKRAVPDADREVPEASGTSPDVGLESRQRAEVVRQAVQALMPAERDAIETAFFAECSHAEVALQLRAPVGTVKTRIRSGLTKLRQALAAQFPGG